MILRVYTISHVKCPLGGGICHAEIQQNNKKQYKYYCKILFIYEIFSEFDESCKFCV